MTAPAGDRYYDVTRSVCPECRRLVQARVIGREGRVLLQTQCPEHGRSEALVYSDEAFYLEAQGYCKPGSVPRVFSRSAERGCPDSCGFCPEHEQHVCMPIVELTDACYLECPVCLVGKRGNTSMSRASLEGIVARLLAAEGTIQVLNLSGGEPTLHPEYESFLEYLTGLEQILRVSVSTNGLRLAEDDRLRALHKRLDVVVSLQFDGFRDETSARMRGRTGLARLKRDLLERLVAEDLTASLTVTLAKGVNEGELAEILTFYFAHDNFVSMTVQPFAHEGHGCTFPHDPLDRITIPEAVDLLSAASGGILEKGDFTPLPCSHPACFCLTFLLATEGGGWLPIKRVLPVDDYLDLIRNRSYIDPQGDNVDRMRGLLYELWSGPVALVPAGAAALRTIKHLLREIDAAAPATPKRTVRIAERRMKSVFIHQFMDAETFDLSRARRCCSVYPKEDGRFYPACVYNVLRRGRD
ncbi:MAG: radical SAM protein [Candidatus Riflebacteria bacterium]|nr:radical SAM protein [Candidatus Riflebacteria bacterium]